MTPDKYKTMVLIQNNRGSARMRSDQKSQLANESCSPVVAEALGLTR